MLAGEPGFARTADEHTIVIAAAPVPGDPLGENTLYTDAAIGLLAIELSTRWRMRMNGRIESYQNGILVISTEQVYSNCPKYIQVRKWEHSEQKISQPRMVSRTSELGERQQKWIEGADTFFIATAHPESGADVSHRGESPGFVHVEHATHLVFPDYVGNTMFQTLGNITVNPHAGPLFIDFMTGNTLQLTGKAQINWDEQRAAAFAGAQRVVEFAIDEVIEIAGAVPFHAQLLEYSPFNPRKI